MPAVAARVWETSTTTGNGNLTLAGARAGCRTFASMYPDGVRFPYMIAASDNSWEHGTGYLSSGALVRESVLENSAGNSSALSFSAALLNIFCVGENQAWPGITDVFPGPSSVKTLCSAHQISNPNAGNSSISANTLHLSAFLVPFRFSVSSLVCQLGTAAAVDGRLAMGIYSMRHNASPGKLICSAQSDAPGINSTGVKALSISGGPIVLPPGWYLTALMAAQTASFYCISSSWPNSVCPIMGGTLSNQPQGFTRSISAGWASLPTDESGTSYTNSNVAVSPAYVLMR